MTLEYVAQESIMCFFKALEVVLENFILSFEYLDFAQGQGCIETVAYVV